MTIIGGKGNSRATLDVKKKSRIFAIKGDNLNVKIRNCNLINANAVGFYGVTGRLSNCTFKDMVKFILIFM